MGFLSGWNPDNRIKIKIQSDNITGDLINYPVLIKISTSSGINSTDLSAVFDELTSDANRKKIAFTTDDGTTEIPVESQDWDDASELSWLWVKVPFVSSINITTLFLYYDSTHADNPNIGDVGEAISQTVWDSNHKGVWHLDEDPTGAGSPMKDSTSNGNNGSNKNDILQSSDSVTGLIGNALDFDENEGGIELGALNDLELLGDLTLTAIAKTTLVVSGADTIIAKDDADSPEVSATNVNYRMSLITGVKFRYLHEYDSGDNEQIDSSNLLTSSTQYVLEIVRDDTAKTVSFYVDGVFKESGSYTNSATGGASSVATIGYKNDGGNIIQTASQIVEEVRIQDTVRSAAWVKANNFNFRDTLIDYSVAATTFSDLINLPTSKKVQLSELQLAERVDNQSWTQHGTFTNVFSITYFEDTISLKGTTGIITDTANNGGGLLRVTTSGNHNLTNGSTVTIAGLATAAQNGKTPITNVNVTTFDCDLISFATVNETGTFHQGDTDTIRKRVTAMSVGLSGTTTPMTRLSDLANVDTTSNSFFHDVENKLLYVNVNAGSNPETAGIMTTLFTLYFSTHHGIVFGNTYYEPYIKNTPGINSASQTLLSGFAETTAGAVQFNNDNGYFDRILELYLWENRTVTIRYGGDSLPFDEYETAFVGIIESREWSRRIVTLRLKSNQMQLLRRIPENVFDTTTFPNMDVNKVGNPIPIAYGTFTERNAPEVTAIDESDVLNHKIQFQITDHINNSIDDVWADYNKDTDNLANGGSGWVALTKDAALSVINTYKIDDAPTNKKITIRFIDDGYKKLGRTKVKVGFKATEGSDTNLMTSPSDIVKDILKTYNGFTDSDLDLSEFAASKTNSANTVAIYLDKFQRTQEIIDRIAVGEPAKFFVNNEGDFILNVWSPDLGATFTTVNDIDDLGIGIKFDSKEFFNKIKVGYAYSWAEKNWLYVSSSDDDAKDLYKEQKQKVIFTYLDNSSDALILAQRYLLLLKTPTAEVNFSSKWQLSEKKITDRIKINSGRAPESSIGAYTGKIFEITAMSRNFDSGRVNVKCEDLKGILDDIGQWTADTAPSWSGATETQRSQSGFWMNANGQATAGDPSSLNRSIWF